MAERIFSESRGANTRYVVEKRKPDGTLDFSDPQPPPTWFGGVSSAQLCHYFFKHNPEAGESVSQDEIIGWFEAKGWRIREKTW